MTMLSQITASGGGVPATYIEDVFSTYLYTGNGGVNTITNGIDLSGKGGLVWIKSRDNATAYHCLFDTVRASPNMLSTNVTTAEVNATNEFGSFSSTGFGLVGNTVYGYTNYSPENYVSWSFRKQAKFFDIVTWTGNGASGRQISHSLGSVPGFLTVKRLSATSNWPTWHRSLGAAFQFLNTTAASNADTSGNFMGNDTTYIAPTSTYFTIGAAYNVSGSTYVAYLFAHDAGGFGLNGTDNVISCGSYTGTGGTNSVTLGYEPQFVLIKEATEARNWVIMDTMRGWTNTSSNNDITLAPNSSNSEITNYAGHPTATGFAFNNTDGDSVVNANGQTYIYIAIRKGPMKVPTDGTKVFEAVTYTGNNTTRTIPSSITADLAIVKRREASAGATWGDRLRANNYLDSSGTAAETTAPSVFPTNAWDVQGGMKVGTGANATNNNGSTYVDWMFRRAPSFFDTVCYTGTGAAMSVTHNLGTAPQIVISKSRSAINNWWASTVVNWSGYFTVESTGPLTTGFSMFGTPTSTQFFPASGSGTQNSGENYVAYLFATCPGVSKVGSYTGTGTTKQVDCGFTAGARFVLIKRTDSSGDWYIWDSTRGIVAGNDPYLLLNSSAAEVTSTDYVDTYAAGFELSSTAPAALNASGGTYFFIAIA